MNHGAQTTDNPLHAGHDALARTAWNEARTFFLAALDNEETPEALEGLGMAAWGLNDTAVTFDAREKAYRLYRQRDDYQGAARVATSLALDHFYGRGEYAIANGWLQRAGRLLEGQTPGEELGWLCVAEAQIAGWAGHGFAAVQQLAAQAAALGKSLGNVDLEMVALACEGLALVHGGMISEGMRRLDEATLAVAAGEMTVVDAACLTCCSLIFACEGTRDYQRAAQWIERLKEISTRLAHPTMFFFCRTHYAGLLIWQGDWVQAEAELESAITELGATQPARAAEALVRLTILRCQQGQFEAAAALAARAESPPFRALAGDFCLLARAVLALEMGDAETAVDLAERFLRAIPQENILERFDGLELLVLALAADGAAERAQVALAEMAATADSVATKPMQAAVCFATGVAALAAEAYDLAKRSFEDAVEYWLRSGAPFETAQARLGLAQALLALGRRQAAKELAHLALDALQQLGARPGAGRAAALLQEIERAPVDGRGPDLTLRELEVLRLMAAGKSNQEIARELVLSVRTVERHISNIYQKIGAGGTTARVAAITFARQHNLA